MISFINKKGERVMEMTDLDGDVRFLTEEVKKKKETSTSKDAKEDKADQEETKETEE